MCAAGRLVIYPGVDRSPGWHYPCTKLGLVTWLFRLSDDRSAQSRVCATHDRQLCAKRAPWVSGVRLSEHGPRVTSGMAAP